jgi:hypothetical protein
MPSIKFICVIVASLEQALMSHYGFPNTCITVAVSSLEQLFSVLLFLQVLPLGQALLGLSVITADVLNFYLVMWKVFVVTYYMYFILSGKSYHYFTQATSCYNRKRSAHRYANMP